MTHLSASAIIILQAVLGIGLLTFVMAVWSGLTRLPAMKRVGLELQDAAHAADFRDKLPSSVRRINDNYNHLFEAPTVFYAAALSTVALGAANGFYAGCALAYLALRVVHSLVQGTINRVSVRSPLYILSWLALFPMIVGPLLGTLWRSA